MEKRVYRRYGQQAINGDGSPLTFEQYMSFLWKDDMKRCADPKCGHVEKSPDAKYCAICGGKLVEDAGPGGWGASGETGYEVYLLSPGKRIIEVIKVIRQYTDLGLKEAKDLAESAPGAVCSGIAEDVAENVKRDLEAAGARAEVRAATGVGEIKTDSGSERADAPDYAVVLTDGGSDEIKVIKVIRQFTKLGLKEAKDLVESGPGAAYAGLTKETAESLAKVLGSLGIAAEVRSGYSGYDGRQEGSFTPGAGDTHAPIEPAKGPVSPRSCMGALTLFLIVLVIVIALV